MIKDVDRYGQPVVSQLVYDRTKEQRDFWKDHAENLTKINARLTARVVKLTNAIKDAHSALQDSQSDRGAE